MTLKLIVIHSPKKGYDNNVEPITIKGKNLHDEYLQLLNILKERTAIELTD